MDLKKYGFRGIRMWLVGKQGLVGISGKKISYLLD
jgi:hypothetical protein